MYSLIDVNGGENEKAKGVNKNIFNKIRHKEFVDNNNKLHRIGIYHVCKISLPYFDDNRCILDDGIYSLAYFHKDIEVNKIG